MNCEFHHMTAEILIRDKYRSRLKGAHILLVEDNIINQKMAQALLNKVGVSVKVANNGREALQLLVDAAASYDGVLMDIQMPEMDGYETTQRIRKNMANDTLPIIAMTADDMSSDKKKCLEAGMNDHVAKPIEPENLFTTLSKWIHPNNNESGYSADSSVSHKSCEDLSSGCLQKVSVDPHQPPPDDVTETGLPVLDWNAGLGRVNGNKTLFRELLQLFCRDYGNAIDHLKHLMDAGKQDDLLRYLHNLKGIAGNLGAMQTHASALALEKLLRKTDIEITNLGPKELNHIHDLMDVLQGNIDKTGSTVETWRPDQSSAKQKADNIPEAPGNDPGLEPQKILTLTAKMMKLIDAGSMDAIDCLKTIKRYGGPWLRTEIEPLEKSINNLDYDCARKHLLDITAKVNQNAFIQGGDHHNT